MVIFFSQLRNLYMSGFVVNDINVVLIIGLIIDSLLVEAVNTRPPQDQVSVQTHRS